MIKIEDREYSPPLKEIPDPPQQLYVRGNTDLLRHPHLLAVVGSRKANSYGQQCAIRLLPPLARAGIPLVSGLAYGIDSLAHRACVDQQQPTIAVLGSGIDDQSIYPSINVKLARRILDCHGLLISEYSPGTKPAKHHFPMRNRIIAGLSQAVLVLQASDKSGSLITARLALEDNRDVCAVPGPITDPLSAGTNYLIQQGAYPVTCAQDIATLLQLELALQPEQAGQDISPEQSQILSKLSNQPRHVDAITARLHLPPHTIAALLTELELAGLVQHMGGMKYVKK